MTKKFCLNLLFLCCLSAPLQAEILTIDKEPAELTKLRASYEQQMQSASTPEKMQQLQKEFEAAKAKALESAILKQKIASLEQNRDMELKKILALYQERIDALQKEAVNSVERKYQVVFDNFKNKSRKNVKNQYIVELKRLEDKLVRQNNLAGALVVQNERNKAMGISVAAAAPAPAPKAPAPAKAAPAPAPKAAAKPAAAPAKPLGPNNPKIYRSTTQGVAGSGSNVTNNVYSFDVQLYGGQTWLAFNGYGRETNNSFGEVYLITPAGQRHQVASWSPDQLKATSYYGVKGAQDVQPVKTNITQYMTAKGTYQVEFTYRDGNEPLYIYQVEIKSW